MKYLLSLLWLFPIVIAESIKQPKLDKCAPCDIPYRSLGCYRDNGKRPLPKQILNERDLSSAVSNGQKIDWGNWASYMPQMVCRCATQAKLEGYKYFAIQFWGECWAGNNKDAATALTAPEQSCYNRTFGTCLSTDRNCVGEAHINYVYQLEEITCPDVKFERVGCFRDHHNDKRPLPDYIYQERDDTRADNYGNRDVDWHNFDLYAPQFACRCAQKAKEANYAVFGLQFYGECWSGPNLTYFIDGKAQCTNRCYGKCLKTDKYCVGRNRELFVYRIKDETCASAYSAVGCLEKADITSELILTEEDPRSDLFNGHYSCEADWYQRFPEFVCACSMRAREKGVEFFGVTNKGECFGTQTDPTPLVDDGSYCVQADSSPCNDSASLCGGAESTLFFYRTT